MGGVAHAAAHPTMSPAVGQPASLALLVSPVEMSRAHIATDLACWSIAMVEAWLDLMVYSCMAKPLSAVRRGEAAAGLHGSTQRTPAAHGRTAEGLLSIIGSADAGHIAYEPTSPATPPPMRKST